MTTSFKPGTVALVGAGPGDPELITLKAVRRLKFADVIFTDALANPELLVHCRSSARVLDVGKLAPSGAAPGRSTPQEVICRLLVEEARAGHRVVRLKGGDPFVFGRGGEEALFLAEHGVPFEVVPGLSSATAVPAAELIPVTHRGAAQSLTVVTGTSARDDDGLARRWAALAEAGGTLVFLMARRPVARIAATLVEAGLSPHTPAAMIQSGTLPEQRRVDGDLASIAGRVEEAGLLSPALLVVGAVLDVGAALRAAQAPALVSTDRPEAPVPLTSMIP